MSTNWTKINNCNHQWRNAENTGRCAKTEGCSWRECKCTLCDVYEVTCSCGFENTLSDKSRSKIKVSDNPDDIIEYDMAEITAGRRNTSDREFPYLTTVEVGKMKGCAGRTVQNYCESGDIPYVYIGDEGRGRGLYLIHVDDVKDWNPKPVGRVRKPLSSVVV